MSTLSTFLNMSKPADGDTSWGAEIRQALDTLDYLAAPDYTYFVSPAFADGDLFPNGTPTDNRYHATIQAAITEAETQAESDRTTILVYPGAYTDYMTITKSVKIIGIGGWTQFGLPVRVNCAGSDSVVTVNPAAGVDANVMFANMWLNNTVISQGNTTVTWPFWLDITDQGSGNYGTYHNQIAFHNCYFRREVALGADVWTYGFRNRGFSTLTFGPETQIIAGAAATCTKPISIEGNNSTGKTAELNMKRADIQWYDSASGNQLITFDGGTDGKVYDCGFSEGDWADIVSFGGTGTNQCSGLTSGTQMDTYKNARGVNSCVF